MYFFLLFSAIADNSFLNKFRKIKKNSALICEILRAIMKIDTLLQNRCTQQRYFL